MKSTLLFRIASILFVLFALGHTVGFLSFTPPTAEGLAVRDAMNNVHFPIDGADLSYGHFYAGFGFYVSEYLLFSAFLAWQLGKLANEFPEAIQALAWAFFAVQLASLTLCFVYFATPQVAFTSLVALFLGGATWRLRRSKSSVR